MSIGHANTFNGGVYMDASDRVLKDTMARNMMGMRLVNLDGTSFCVANVRGTEEKFQLSDGFVPLASRDFNEVLYIISYHPTTQEVEIGSFPSPDYAGDGSGNQKYRPFNNLDEGQFRTTAYGLSEKPAITDVRVQPDYDSSVNVIFTLSGKPPRIVNSKFKVVSDTSGNRTYEVIEDRPGLANSNEYTSATVDKETKLILASDKILKIEFGAIGGGGKLKPGNYIYVFHYMTENFNRTEVVGQSLTCQVAFGSSENNIKGGDETQETNKKVTLTLSRVDIDFKYLKVYCLYSSGQEATFQQYLEFTNPVNITGETMIFTHSGFEPLAEVSQDVVNTDFTTLEHVTTITEIDDILIGAGITERTYDFAPFREAAAALTPTFATKEVPTTLVPGYMDPANVYNYLGHFGGESYPYGIVFILPGNALSPVFPIQGQVFTSSMSGANPTHVASDQDNGVVTFPTSNHYQHFSSNKPQAKHLKFDVSGIPQDVKDIAIGFFFVRGQRNPWLITQGALTPTLRVAKTEYLKGGGDDQEYYEIYNLDSELDAYGFIPCIDNLLEAYAMDEVGTSLDPVYVVDDLYQLSSGYMPIWINDMRVMHGATAVDNYSTRHWAFISGDGLVDEPGVATRLLRDTAYVFQVGKMTCLVKGEITPIHIDDQAVLEGNPVPDVGLHYDMQSLHRYNDPGFKLAESINYVPAESFATGSDFISKVAQRFKYFESASDRGYDVYQSYNSYFGIEMSEDLNDVTKNTQNPLGGNTRLAIPRSADGAQTSGVRYNNYNTSVNAAFLVNIYSSNTRPSATDLYPNVDTISYKQVTPRYSWDDAEDLGNVIDVFGGDCFISKVHRRLNQSGFRNPAFAEGGYKRANIHSGIMLSWWQESDFNLHLRQPVQYDVFESEERSFFPYDGRGNFSEWRKNRYPETARYAKGYGEVLPPKSFFALPEDTPYIESDFFTRAIASDKHIPNAFRNGYRSFTGLNFKDYDPSMGRIIRIFNHYNELLVVFEHGIGKGPINQRIQTGSDSSGPVFLEATSVLPPKLQYLSREFGSQDFYSMYQTPLGVYGVDRQRKKLWQVTDRMTLISDSGFMSFLDKHAPVNPRTGFDAENSEVVFTTDNWTLAYRENSAQMYFMPFKPDFYARLGSKMLSFTDRFHAHNAPGYRFYGTLHDCYLEFVFNKDVNATKIMEWIEIVSNEVKPSKVEFFTYSGVPSKEEVITPEACHQYSKAVDEIDFFTEEPVMEWRDKLWLVQIPNATVYNPIPDIDSWESDGRMRNSHLIIRITYNTEQALELVSVVTNFRYSYS